MDGNQRLERGVYAIVLITGPPEFRSENGQKYWLDNQREEEKRFRVPIVYLKNLLEEPILLEQLYSLDSIQDEGLLNGRQASSWSLEEESFRELRKLSGEFNPLPQTIVKDSYSSTEDILKLEQEFKDAAPEVKYRLTKYIERGKIANEYKKATDFKCQICDAFGLNPIGFKKKDGNPYIETHHVVPVSKKEVGLLGINNLMTLCANHHRQMHYGNVKLIRNTKDEFEFRIDEKPVRIKKIIVDQS